MRRAWLTLVLVAACSKAPPKDVTPHGLCERGCNKLLGCFGDLKRLGDCVTTCLADKRPPDAPRIEKLEATSCDDLAKGGADLDFMPSK